MDNFGDPMLGEEACDQGLVAGIADDEGDALGDGPGKTGGEVVEHHDPLPRLDEGLDHVASDVSGAAGNEDRHDAGSVRPFDNAPGGAIK